MTATRAAEGLDWEKEMAVAERRAKEMATKRYQDRKSTSFLDWEEEEWGRKHGKRMGSIREKTGSKT